MRCYKTTYFHMCHWKWRSFLRLDAKTEVAVRSRGLVSRSNFGELRFLRRVCRAREMYPVAVRVQEQSVPQCVADLRLGRLDTAGRDMVVDRYGVFALKPERNALAQFPRWLPRMRSLLSELLQHQRRAA